MAPSQVMPGQLRARPGLSRLATSSSVLPRPATSSWSRLTRQADLHFSLAEADGSARLATLTLGSTVATAAALALVGRGQRRGVGLDLLQLLTGPRPVAVIPLEGACLGACVEGVDLGEEISSELAERLRAALQEHGMLVFRGQRLSQRAVLRAATVFGHPVPAEGQEAALAIYHVRDRDRLPRGQDFWHSDNSYLGAPGGPTILYALKIPRDARGKAIGDTLFADAGAAAESLPVELRKQVAGLKAAHNAAHNGGHPEPEYETGEWQRREDAWHPILRRNPISGSQALFVSPAYVHSVAGLCSEESQELLDQLFQHMLQPSFTHRHEWEEKDFIVWDNGRLLHKATTLDMPQGSERLMWRVQTVNREAQQASVD